MEIPINSDVRCADKSCGHSVAVILNPVTDQVTHVVVRAHRAPRLEWIVPTSAIEAADRERIALRLSPDELQEMDPFIEMRFIRTRAEHYVGGSAFVPGSTYLWPYVTRTQEPLFIPEREEHVPVGEVAVHRGAEVRALDGDVGKVDEFIVGPDSGHVTHLLIGRGFLWWKRDVAVPMSEVREVTGSTVYLKLAKQDVLKLPAVPVRRKYRR